jgi:hypothetical protein
MEWEQRILVIEAISKCDIDGGAPLLSAFQTPMLRFDFAIRMR